MNARRSQDGPNGYGADPGDGAGRQAGTPHASSCCAAQDVAEPLAGGGGCPASGCPLLPRGHGCRRPEPRADRGRTGLVSRGGGLADRERCASRAPLARLVLTAAASTTTPGQLVAVRAHGYDAAGRDLGDVTASTAYSIDPDGTCAWCPVRCGPPRPAHRDGHRRPRCPPGHRQHHDHRHRAGRAVAFGLALARGLALALRYRPAPARAPPPDPPAPADPAHARAHRDPGAPRHPGSWRVERQDDTGPRRPDPAGAPAGPTATPGSDRRSPAAGLVLTPVRTFAHPGEPVTYAARAVDADGEDLGDVTPLATVTITFSAGANTANRPGGACTATTCTAERYGRHTITGVAEVDGATLTGTAALQVVPRIRWRVPLDRLATVEPTPASSVVDVDGERAYTATGYDSDHRLLGDVTAVTAFEIGPDGSCAGATCTGGAAGPHTVTGTVDVRGRLVKGTASLLVVPRLSGLLVAPRGRSSRSGTASVTRQRVGCRRSPGRRPHRLGALHRGTRRCVRWGHLHTHGRR